MTLGSYIDTGNPITEDDGETDDIHRCPSCKKECFKTYCPCGWSEEMVETIHLLTANKLISYKTTPEKPTA